MQQWQPGHWFGPVTQPFFFYHATQIKNKKTEKIKKIEKNKKIKDVYA
jgi:hypothetical protein